jgi:uncharacterized protein (TIGR03000 family)
MFKRMVAFSSRAGMAIALALLIALPASAQQGFQLYDWSGGWNRNPAGDYGFRFYGDSEPAVAEGTEVSGMFYPGMNAGYAFYPSFYAPQFAYQQPGAMNSYQSLYSPQASGERSAMLNISAPPNAEIWFGETKMTAQNGNSPLRQFASPPLTLGRDYSYEIKVRWTEDGQPVTQNRTVGVHAGDVINLMFKSDRY